jgi:hypothetical protein
MCASNTSSVWHTRLSSGAPDSVRCARLAGGEPAALGKKQRHTTIIHRTKRWLCASNTSSVWHTGLSGGAPDSVWCARLAGGELTALGKKAEAYDYNSLDLSGGAPDCPVSQRSPAPTVGRAIRGRRVARSNGRLGTPDCPVCTGQCPVRQPTPRTNGRMRQIWKEITHRTATVTVW